MTVLTVDPGALRVAARGLAQVAEALDSAGSEARHVASDTVETWHGRAATAYRSTAAPQSLLLHAQAERLRPLASAVEAYARVAEHTIAVRRAADSLPTDLVTGEVTRQLRHTADEELSLAVAELVRSLHAAEPEADWLIPQSFAMIGDASVPASAHIAQRLGGILATQIIKRVYRLPWQRKAAKAGWNDLRTGGGYSGWRGAVTRVMGGVEMLGVAAVPRGGAVSVVGVTAIAIWGVWKVANRIHDSRAQWQGDHYASHRLHFGLDRFDRDPSVRDRPTQP